MRYFMLLLLLICVGCVPPVTTPPPVWNAISEALEKEYIPYQENGSFTLTGQAFLTQSGGGVVKAAGRNIELVPATTIGNEWWGKAGLVWSHRNETPSSPKFHATRKTVVADADGRFSFKGLPPGKYLLRTEITWNVAYWGPQGGIVNTTVDLQQSLEVILNHM